MARTSNRERRVRRLQRRLRKAVRIRIPHRDAWLTWNSTTTELTASWSGSIAHALSLSPSNKVVEYGIRGVSHEIVP